MSSHRARDVARHLRNDVVNSMHLSPRVRRGKVTKLATSNISYGRIYCSLINKKLVNNAYFCSSIQFIYISNACIINYVLNIYA